VNEDHHREWREREKILVQREVDREKQKVRMRVSEATLDKEGK
jgi:hypothetical protein